MKKIQFQIVAVIVAATLLAGCAGTPVLLGSRVDGHIPAGESRTISSEACGFQLFLFIPISINSRAQRAYQSLELEAGGDFITNVQVKERWAYGFVGTKYCTEIKATAIRSPVKTTQQLDKF